MRYTLFMLFFFGEIDPMFWIISALLKVLLILTLAFLRMVLKLALCLENMCFFERTIKLHFYYNKIGDTLK